MEMISRSFRLLDRGSSLNHSKRLARSNSSLLDSELLSDFDISRFAAYQKLSESMRLTTEPSSNSFGRQQHHRRSNRTWSLFRKVFSLNMIDSAPERSDNAATSTVRTVVAVEKKKKRSSWMPDPNRRWPVQGW